MPSIQLRQRKTVVRDVDDLVKALEKHSAGKVNATKLHETWAIDWRLPVAEDAPFKSSLEYDPRSNELKGIALRFSPKLFDRFSDEAVQERFETIIEDTDRPKGTLWHSYIRGDAEETGPHILAPSGFSEVDAEEFVNWLTEVLGVYRKLF